MFFKIATFWFRFTFSHAKDCFLLEKLSAPLLELVEVLLLFIWLFIYFGIHCFADLLFAKDVVQVAID